MMNTQNDWPLELGRLVALAERCASEGQMNLNKLVEAAVYAQVRRTGWRFRPQVTVATMQSEIEAGLQFLKQDNIALELIAALEVGRQALAEHRHADLLFTEAPDVFVCRTCGHVALGSPPDHCPDCGAWPGRFRKFVAFFNQDNTEPINPIEVLAMLARNAEDLSRLVEGLSEEATSQTPAGSDWSIRDHVAHFSDTQDMLDTRIELMLKHDNPELTAIAVYEFATEAERHPSSARAILAEFRAKRAKCVARLEALPLKDLWRPGRHLEFGQLTILRQAAYLAFHEQTHLPEVEALRMQVA
jgi:rubrerythrin